MNPVILIHTTPRDKNNGIVAAVRESWAGEWKELISHYFMYDQTYEGPAEEDELIFDEPAGYWVMMHKTKAAVEWALAAGHDYVFIICSDSYVIVPRLLVSGYEKHDYTGHRADEGHAGAGCGYWLSGRAMQAVLDFPTFPDYEDRWVGAACRAAGIECHHDPRYWGAVLPYLPGIITVYLHQGAGKMNPLQMIDQHTTFMVEKEICVP